MSYLDWASTSPPEAGLLAEAERLATENFGNPSSRHGRGAEAKALLEEARARLAASLGLSPELSSNRREGATPSIVFTSGGSEADALPLLALLRSALNARRDGSIKRLHIVTTSIEHAAVFEETRLLESLGLELSRVDPEPDGRVSPEKLAAAVRRETALVAAMAVNNETGAVQDLAAMARDVRSAADALGRKPPRFHADAVQALGKIAFAPATLGISSAAFTAHKIRGPRGIGALWNDYPLEPLALGGGQEGGLRPGTENLQGAWAFARAAERAIACLAESRIAARSLEARLLDGLTTIAGTLALPLGRKAGDETYSPFILSVAFPGLSGEVLARALSDEGIAVSTGSACSNNARGKGRRVLEAMGLAPDIAFSAIRISTGQTTKAEDIDLFLETASRLYRRLKA